jgi:photosystem II stability/assembly factor-like uncharacterized protein
MKTVIFFILYGILFIPFLLSGQIVEGDRPDELPDIRITDLDVSTIFPEPSKNVDIIVTVSNLSFSKSNQVKVQLQVNNQVIGEKNVLLNSNENTRLTFKWKTKLEGQYLVRAIADPEWILNELDRTDNILEKNILVAKCPSRRSDFNIISMEKVIGEEGLNQIKVSIAKGGKRAESVPLLLRQGDKILEERLIGPLSPGEQSSQVFTLPSTIWQDRISIEINPRFAFRERNSENNIAFLDPSLSGTDLQARNLSVHANKYQQGEQRMVTVNFEIVNLGSLGIANSFRSRIRALPENVSPKDVFVSTSGLRANESTYVSYTFEDAPERFEIIIDLDLNNAVQETNESNNQITGRYKNPAPPVNRWVSIGPRLIFDTHKVGYPWKEAVGRLSAIAIHPTSTATMYVGAKASGIWKTTNGGNTWFPLTDHLTLSVAALALDPNNPSRVFWATKKEGFYRSNNGGLSWTQLTNRNLNAIVYAGKLIVNPQNSNILYLASGDGVYRSTDGGFTWTLVKSGGAALGLVMSPFNSNLLYASIKHDSNNNVAGVFMSADGGNSWTKLRGCSGGDFLPSDMTGKSVTLAISGNRLFVGIRTANDFQLYRTTDIGCSVGGRPDREFEKGWRTTTDHKLLWRTIWANPLDADRLYMGGTGFWRSTNGGMNFEMVSEYGTPQLSAHVDHHSFAVLPGNKDVIFSLNDGGIYRSDQNAKAGTWKFIGKGLHNVEFYDFAQAFTEPDLLIGGTQDNGTMRTDGSLDWRAIRGGDGATVDIDHKDEDIMYSMNQYAGSIARSTDGGDSWNGMASGLPSGSSCFNLTFGLHPTKSNILLAPCGALWRITDPSGNWQSIFTPPVGSSVIRWAVDPSTDLYFAGTNRGKVSAGVGGSNWAEIFSHPMSSGIIDIEVDPVNPRTVWVVCTGNNAGRVYLLQRSGGPTSGFSNRDITGNLPTDLAVQCIAVDRMNDNTIYVGTKKGVYKGRSYNNGQNWYWTSYNDGLPLADVRDMEVHPVTGVLQAITHGRSAFEISTGPPLGSVLSIEGKPNFLRVHDVGTKYGPPNDVLDAEVITKLDTDSRKYFGTQLRPGNQESAHVEMLNHLRMAFEENMKIKLEYIRTGINSGKILRVMYLND